jgi:PilZ domain
MEEHRKEPRQRTLKAATIMIAGKSVIDCKVRNLTHKGASLEIGSLVGIPAMFELSIPVDNLTLKCRVRWRKSNQIGISFI